MVDETNAAVVELEAMQVEALQWCECVMLRHEMQGLVKK